MNTNAAGPAGVGGATPQQREFRGHVAVGVDGSPQAEQALRQAVREAQLRGAELEIVHGRPWNFPRNDGKERRGQSPSRQDARELVDAAAARARELAPELRVSTSVVEEDAPEALVDLTRRAALTVVGSRGLGGFRGLMLGSVSLRVAAHAAGPLLVVRGDAETEDGGRAAHGTVLVGVEDQGDRDTVAVAFQEAAARGAPLTALHAWTYRHFTPPGEPLVPTSPMGEDIARISRREATATEQMVAPFREKYPQMRAQVRTVRGGAAHALVEASETADVVVVGTHRGRGPLAMRLGPVAHSLLHHSHSPVLVVPVRSGEDGEER